MVLRALIASVIIAVAGAYAHGLRSRSVNPQALPDFTQIPSTLQGWTSQDFVLSENVAEVLKADAVLNRVYRHQDGREVMVFMAYFAQQAVNSQIHSPRHCVPGGGWHIMSLDQETLSLPGGPQNAARMLVARNEQKQQIDYWFRTRTRTLAGEYALKWDLVRNALANRPTDALFVRYSASLDNVPAMHEVMAELDRPLAALETEVGLR